MYFSKIRHPSNFVFVRSAEPASGILSLEGEKPRLIIEPIGGDVHRVTVEHARWPAHSSQAELESALSGPTAHALALDAKGVLSMTNTVSGDVVLSGASHGMFGSSGKAWMFQFQHESDMQFYGLGEHNKNLEKSGQRTKFWNTDVMGDFSAHEVAHGHPNPMYVAIPWLIIKRGNRYIGILVHNPGAVFMDLASNFIWVNSNAEDRARQSFYVGAPDGRPELYFIAGPSLPELTRKLQTLVGRTPLPPLWALGHQQCRWGYAGPRDLKELDSKFTEHAIPTDGLWLDIDYMDRYKVFTFSPEHWGDEAAVKKAMAALAKKGRRVIPILDPGVKVEPGYAVCEDGLKAGIFCLNPAGTPFVGFVWPGQTYFPDYSLPEACAWWSERVKTFAETGVSGAWLDMNDPSVGAVELDDMLFDHGTKAHESYHNQYAFGMARASHAGFLAARPDTRPFLLARSAYISSARYTAIWTGDNVSNWHHLRMTIPVSVGLALSGIPFNGPDVCGFGDSTTPKLAIAWYKSGFLFPFLRNHSVFFSLRQEPWALGATALGVISHYIRLRYKLLPYLYQLFVAQEAAGEAILRPLFHDFSDTPELPLGKIEDQFLVGPAILQAPVLQENATSRAVVLPGAGRWLSALDGRWLAGGTHQVKTAAASTPLYLREGSLVPMQAGERTHNRNDLTTIELHCVLRADTTGEHRLDYVCDDGESFAYRRGERTSVTFYAEVVPGVAKAKPVLRLTISDVKIGWRSLKLRVVAYGAFSRVEVVRAGARAKILALAPHTWRFTGSPLRTRATGWIAVKT